MRWVFLFLGMLLAMPVTAQPGGAMGGAAANVQAESLTPVSLTQPVPPPPPFTILGVVATLNESEGFARDSALTLAARIALPKAIEQLNPGMEMEKAETAAKSVGDPMQFVKSYKILKEVLVPKYQITVDLVFDPLKLKKNFGHLMVTETVTSRVAVGVTGNTGMAGGEMGEGLEEGAVIADTASATAPITEGVPQVIYLRARSALAQDKFFSALEKAGLAPVWQSIRRDGGVLAVTSKGTLDDLAAALEKLGYAAVVSNSTVEVTL